MQRGNSHLSAVMTVTVAAVPSGLSYFGSFVPPTHHPLACAGAQHRCQSRGPNPTVRLQEGIREESEFIRESHTQTLSD